MLAAQLRSVAQGVAQAHGGQAEVWYLRDAPATVNAAAQTGYSVAVAEAISRRAIGWPIR